MPKIDSTTAFVHRANIDRYRRLLGTELDAQERQIVLDLLAQAEKAEREAVGTTGVASARAGHIAA